ncbi:MAG: aspartyl protease family protein [Cyanobacteria bacterium P01_F01_bin.42]
MRQPIGFGLVLSIVMLGSGCARETSNAPLGTVQYDAQIDVTGRLVRLPLSINGAVSIPFILDTGSANLIVSQDYAQDAGARTTGKTVTLTGVGGAVRTVDVVRNLLIDLDGVQWPIGEAMIAPTGMAQRITELTGEPFNGMIGAQIFESYVVEIDYQTQQLTLYPPNNYRYSGPGVTLSLTFRGRKPYVQAAIQETPEAQPLSGTFLLDTGSSQALDIRGLPFATAGLPQRHAAGVGGEVLNPVGRIYRLKLGPFDIASPITAFERSKSGQDKLSGRIGNQILSQFKVIFNYAQKQVIFEPVADQSALMETDMSGLRLSLSSDGDVVVDHVYAPSPAKAAGIQVGDRLRSIDEESVEDLSLAEVRQKLIGETQRRLVLERNQRQIPAELNLRRLI